MNNANLEPWARGPFELIRHANEHLQAGGDTDRRIALIGFDNAIEVCIDVFIKLHPRLRGGHEITHADAEKALRNYHSKIEFLDKYVELQQISLDVSIEAIVWYHSLRNELYHSGNGMVPEIHVLEGARSASASVFKALFKTDLSHLLGEKVIKQEKHFAPIPFATQNDKMELLRLFVDFERTLERKLQSVSPSSDKRPKYAKQMWNEYKTIVKVSNEWDAVVQKAILLRNNIAHGRSFNLDSDEVLETYLQLMDITESIKSSDETGPTLKSRRTNNNN